jgi:hypothetical protein
VTCSTSLQLSREHNPQNRIIESTSAHNPAIARLNLIHVTTTEAQLNKAKPAKLGHSRSPLIVSINYTPMAKFQTPSSPSDGALAE